MTRETAIFKANKFIIKPLKIMMIISFSGLPISPFIWIWYTYILAWKVALSGGLAAIIIYFLIKILVKFIAAAIIEKHPIKKPTFKSRIIQMQKNNNENRHTHNSNR